MGRILQALSTGELITEPSIKNVYDEYTKALNTYCDLGDKLLERLNEEEKQLFQEYNNACSDEQNLYSNQRFIAGYRLGVLMMIEVFEGRNELLCEGKEID